MSVSDLSSFFIYAGLVIFVTLAILGASSFFPAVKSSYVKYLPYESGIITETNLQKERFPIRHYLVALIFLVFDIEVIFLYPWAVIGKKIGAFAFYEMAFFLIAVLVGFAYVWRKRGLQWE
jgi:NADH-quinone oxidoreductase subunit A